MPDVLHPPLSVIASWPAPNYINPPNRGPALEYVGIVFSVLALTVVSARTYSRVFITRAPGWDDILIVAGLVGALTMTVMIIIANRLYFSGRHIWDIPPSTFAPHRLNVWISQWLFVLAGTAVKISVLLFYRRLSVKFNKGFLIATWIGIIYNVLFLIAFSLLLLLICQPVEAYWNSFNPTWAATHKYHCANQAVSIPVAIGLSVLGDLYSTLLPLTLIFNLSLPIKQKLALYSLFGLGFLACAFGVVRLVLTYRMLNKTFDFTWLLWEMWIWSIVGLYVAIFAASAPALRPFFRRFVMESIASSAKRSRQHSDSGATVAYEDHDGKRVSSSMTGALEMDEKKIGLAYAANTTELRERESWKEVGRRDTRWFGMRSSRDSKIIPKQVYMNDVSIPTHGPQPAFTHTRKISTIRKPIQDWPVAAPPPTKPLPMPPVSKRPFVPSQASQQTIHVGLQLEPDTFNPSRAGGSVKAARIRAEAEMGQPPQQANTAVSRNIPDEFEVTPQTPSPKKKDPALRHIASTMKPASTPGRSVRSPTRDFDPERREYAHGRRDGYMI